VSSGQPPEAGGGVPTPRSSNLFVRDVQVALRLLDIGVGRAPTGHDLRHEGACRLLADGVDIRTMLIDSPPGSCEFCRVCSEFEYVFFLKGGATSGRVLMSEMT